MTYSVLSKTLSLYSLSLSPAMSARQKRSPKILVFLQYEVAHMPTRAMLALAEFR